MRFVAIAVIAAIAAFMGYRALVGECPGGAVVRSQEHCASLGSLDDGLCRQVFENANAVARSAGTVYTDRDECFRIFGNCLSHATVVGGYVPQPAGFCVKASGRTLVSMVPVYRAAAAR